VRLQQLLTSAQSDRSSASPAEAGAARQPMGKRLPLCTKTPAVRDGGDGPLAGRLPCAENLEVSARRIRKDESHSPRTKQAEKYVRQLVGNDDGCGGGALDWRLCQDADAIHDLLQEEQSRQQAQQQRHKYQCELRDQQQARVRRERDQENEKKRYGLQLLADASQYIEEECLKCEARQYEQKKINEAQRRQMEDLRQRRQTEREAERQRERDEQDRNATAIKMCEAAANTRRQRNQAMAESIAGEARAVASRRAEEKREQQLRDIDLLKSNHEQLDRQDVERHAVTKFNNRQTLIHKKFEAVADEVERRRSEEASRTKRQQEEKTEKDRLNEEAKQRLVKQRVEESKAMAESQLKEKEAGRIRERDESMRLAEVLKKQAEAAVNEDKARQQQRRDLEKANAQFLQAQMTQKSSIVPGRCGHEQMSNIEKAMNRDRLDRAMQPDSLDMIFQCKQMSYRVPTPV